MSPTPVSFLDLAAEVDRLRSSPRARTPRHLAKTLLRTPSLRLVLLAMDAGARIADHRTEGPITIQVLDGRARLATAGSHLDLAAGQMVSLEHDVVHAIEALERCALLVTISFVGHHAVASVLHHDPA